jgi:arylsulfatase A-like enzyme
MVTMDWVPTLMSAAGTSLDAAYPSDDEDLGPIVFDRLKRDWEAWNDTMLPERPRPATYGSPGSFMADHYGAAPSGHAHTR